MTNKNLLLELFELVGIKKKNITQLNNVEIPRDVLLDKKIIEKCFNMISDLKKKYSSNIFTCLHQNSNEKQRFPGINMFRQILKANGYNLNPQVVSNGYCPITGKKNVIRSFTVVKCK